MAVITDPYTQQSPVPSNLQHALAHPKSPWKFSEALFTRLQNASKDATMSYHACEVLQSDPEYDFVMKYFMHSKPEGLGITKITALYNPNLTNIFENYLPIISNETSKFPPSWKSETLVDQRKQVHKRWKQLRNQFQPLEVSQGMQITNLSDRIAVLPLFHGTDLSKCDSIAETGFTYFGKHGGAHIGSNDMGYYGSGIYFNDSARYAAMYYPESILLAFVSMRPPYPVVSDQLDLETTHTDMKILEAKGAYRDYNAHFIPVEAINDTSLNYYPTLKGHLPAWDEYVVFHSSQALPSFRIELGAELLKDPNTPYSLESGVKACQEGNDLIIKWIQEDRSRLTEKTAKGETWLHIASQFGREKLVAFFLKDNTLLNLTTTDGLNAFHYAAAHGHVEVGKLLLSRKSSFATTSIPRGLYPIHLAAENGQLGFMEFLEKTDKTLLLQLTTKGGWTILHFAALIGDLPCLKWAIKKIDKKKLWKVDGDGSNALHLAAERGNKEATFFLLKKDSPFRKLKEQKNNDSLSNILDGGGFTPLLFAAYHNQFTTLKLLLENGAKIKATDRDGYMAIHWASKRGSLKGLQTLIDYKSPIDSRGLYGRTPLHMASFNGRHSLAQLLLEKGADINAQTTTEDSCKTPLHDAVICNDRNMVQILIASEQINVNIRDMRDHTPLWNAVVYNGNIEIILDLMRHPSYQRSIEDTDPNSIAELCKVESKQNQENRDLVVKTLKENS